MITDCVNREYRTTKGIVCAHVHIYADTIAKCRQLEAEAESVLRELADRWEREGKVLPYVSGRTAV